MTVFLYKAYLRVKLVSGAETLCVKAKNADMHIKRIDRDENVPQYYAIQGFRFFLRRFVSGFFHLENLDSQLFSQKTDTFFQPSSKIDIYENHLNDSSQ